MRTACFAQRVGLADDQQVFDITLVSYVEDL